MLIVWKDLHIYMKVEQDCYAPIGGASEGKGEEKVDPLFMILA